MDLAQELDKRMAEASKDTAWVEKLRAAATWEDFVALLAEKDIEAPAELKEVFAASRAGNTGELADDDLEKVSGGWQPRIKLPKNLVIFCREYIAPLFED